MKVFAWGFLSSLVQRRCWSGRSLLLLGFFLSSFFSSLRPRLTSSFGPPKSLVGRNKKFSASKIEEEAESFAGPQRLLPPSHSHSPTFRRILPHPPKLSWPPLPKSGIKELKETPGGGRGPWNPDEGSNGLHSPPPTLGHDSKCWARLQKATSSLSSSVPHLSRRVLAAIAPWINTSLKSVLPTPNHPASQPLFISSQSGSHFCVTRASYFVPLLFQRL